jgi:hypothetical protein
MVFSLDEHTPPMHLMDILPRDKDSDHSLLLLLL